MKYVQWNTGIFLYILRTLTNKAHWKPYLWTPYDERRGLIRLELSVELSSRRYRHSPLTAVYYECTGVEIPNGFWVSEITEKFGFPWYEVLEISYASDACNIGRSYDIHLRNRLLRALNFKMEKSPYA